MSLGTKSTIFGTIICESVYGWYESVFCLNPYQVLWRKPEIMFVLNVYLNSHHEAAGKYQANEDIGLDRHGTLAISIWYEICILRHPSVGAVIY